jgi:rhodanese-related sulfurtransferase
MTTPTRPPRLSTDAVRDWLAQDTAPRLIDVRTPAEFETVHIPGSYNVPLHLLQEHREELARHLGDVVLVCRSGQRAGHAERSLAGTGLPGVHILDGGVTAWQAAGAPVNRGRPRWDLERQVRLIAGGIVLLSVVGSLALPGLEWIAAALGAGLVAAALTNTCLMGMMLAKLPYNRGAACDLESVVRQLAAGGTQG